jgi:hypothetical protein
LQAFDICRNYWNIAGHHFPGFLWETVAAKCSFAVADIPTSKCLKTSLVVFSSHVVYAWMNRNGHVAWTGKASDIHQRQV